MGEKGGRGARARPHTTNRRAPPPLKTPRHEDQTPGASEPQCGVGAGAGAKLCGPREERPQHRVCVGRGGARSPLTAALPSGGAAEHRGELRGHVRGVAKVEAGRRVACGGRLLIRASSEVRA